MINNHTATKIFIGIHGQFNVVNATVEIFG